MNRKVTIVDVARLAGVSVGTASYALNNKKRVSQEAANKVKEAARRLNYHPNFAASQLRRKKSRIISLHIPIYEYGKISQSTWSFYFPIVQGFMSKVKEEGFRLHLEFHNIEETDYTKQLESFVVGYQVDGAAFILHSENDFPNILKLSEIGTNIVTIYHKINDSIPSVRTNNTELARQVIYWLKSLGHRKIAYIDGEKNSFAAIERRKGYLLEMEKSDFYSIFQGDWTLESGVEGLKYFLSQKPIPTAIFCANDHMAIGALKAAKGLNIRIPEDISIVGFDDNFISEVTDPNLTTVKMPLYEVGSKAAQILISNSKISEKKVIHEVLEGKLVIRNSAISIIGRSK